MKIFILFNDYLGGAENIFFQISSVYKIRGEKIKIFILDKKNTDFWTSLESHNVEVIYFNKNLLKFSKSLNALNKYKPIIYTTHVYLTGFVGFLIYLGLVKKKNFIARESTQIFRRYKGIKLLSYKACYLLGYKSVDLLICQTSIMKRDLEQNMTYLNKSLNIKVIPNPFTYPTSYDNNDYLRLENILGNNFLVSAGRLIPEKGFDNLIYAFKRLKKSFPKLKLIILGEGVLRGDLENQIRELNLQKDILLPGFIENVYPFFKNASCCVVSSIREGFPNVLLQMMSQNTNVVSTKCAGDIDIIDGLILSKVNDVDSLYNALLNSLNNNNSYKNRLVFNKELDNRNIDNFINKINSFLNE